MDVAGSFRQWNDIAPEYRDAIGRHFSSGTIRGTTPRPGTWTTAGRNDFVAMKVARDADYLYFYARTREPITSYTDPHWMMLFIDTDRNRDTGWQGYDYVVNRRVKNSQTTSWSTHGRGGGGSRWRKSPFSAQGNELMIAIPRKASWSRRTAPSSSSSNGRTTSRTRTASTSSHATAMQRRPAGSIICTSRRSNRTPTR